MLMRPASDAIIHSAKEREPDGRAPRWILADFDDTLAPGDSHAGLLRYILRRRIWPLLLLPVIALGGLVYLLPSQRRRGISLIWWAITLGLSPLGWRKLVRAQLYQQLPGQLPHRIIGSQMHYRFGGLMPRFYCHGQHKLLPEICALDAELALSDSLHDLPLLGLGKEAWLINPTPVRLQKARACLPHLMVKNWQL
ncbi:HAD family hydrolase [Aeromonas veronii]|uniref:HAD family hydrolase n=1 Tax=Aeromonas veronii TaxID=654 RepID=UPI003D1F5E85